MKKYLFIGLAVLLLAGAGWWFLWPHSSTQGLAAVPADAAVVAESNAIFDAYRDISRSKAWVHLCTNKDFAQMNQKILAVDSTLKNNDKLLGLLANKPVTVAVHQTREKDFDMLYIVDLGPRTKLGALTDLLDPVWGNAGYKVSESSYKDLYIKHLTDKKNGSKMYLSFIGNLLLLSFTEKLIHKSIDARGDKGWLQNPNFVKVHSLAKGNVMLNVYLNHSRMASFMNIFVTPEPSEDDDGTGSWTDELNQALDFSSLSLKVKDENIALNGHARLRDTTATRFHAFAGLGQAGRKAPEVLPARTAVYTSMQFADFQKFYARVEETMAKDKAKFEEYQRALKATEKYTKIDIKADFLSWIGSEVAVGLIRADSSSENMNAEKVLVLHTRDIDDARQGLDRIGSKIKKSVAGLAVKIKTSEYKEHQITRFAVRGFFKLLLGKMAKGLEEPYYTFIDDYVVFANRQVTLENLIDDYEEKKTLEKDEDYDRFSGRFASKSNVFAYMNTRRLFAGLEEFVGLGTWNKLQRNAEWTLACHQWGLQLSAEDSSFKTQLELYYNPPKPEEVADALTASAALAGAKGEPLPENGPYVAYFRSPKDGEKGQVKFRANFRDGKLHGEYRAYWPNGAVRETGRYVNGERKGQWFFYTRRGKQKAVEGY